MPITGYITVTFNATYLGDYRICWRDDSVGPYTCFLANCSDLGTCTVYINPITFSTNTCDQITYNGYVQAACEDPNTTDGAVFWTVVYTPVTDCVPWELTCLGVTTQSSIDIDVKASGILGFGTINITTGGKTECFCSLGPLWNANQVYNTNLNINPWGNTDIQINAWNSTTQTSGTYNWIPGTIFCGRFEGGLGFQNAITQIYTDPCDYSVGPPAFSPSQFGAFCIYKPIITIAPPPPGGTQATAQAVMGLGGIPVNTPITITNAGTNVGTPGTYYAWNQYLGNGRGKAFFEVKVDPVTQKVNSIKPIINYAGNTNYGYYFNTQVESFTFNPADIGGVQGVIGTKPSGLNTTDLGQVIDVVITNQGSGYLSTPSVSIVTANCYTPLAASVSLELTSTSGGTGPCPPFIPGDGCGTYPGNVYPTIPSLPVGSTFTLCYPNNVNNPPWTITDAYQVNNDPGGCCYDCMSLLVEPSLANPNPTITFTNCDTSNVTVTTINSNQIFSCVVNNSWVSTFTDTAFTVLGPCTS